MRILIFLLVVIVSACGQNEKPTTNIAQNVSHQLEPDKKRQEEIINEHLKNGAWKYQMMSQEWQQEINQGLAKDSTIAYLWQQKAMPLLKMRKYEVGIEYLDKAVKYDAQKWQDYRAFTKCIFAKTYKDAIIDFEDYKRKFGYGYVMDHTYDFYIALSYLQLNEFEKAEQIFQADYERQAEKWGKDNLHHLDLFYYGMSKYELRKYEEAIVLFDKSLAIYPDFSEVQLYKAVCLRKLGRKEEAKKYDILAEENGRKGNTINEANAKYEMYPYQWKWQ